ncbi:glycosyltransferase family 39 protein [Solidesulfovibrio sp.]|uniref:glycosyltransferase family 39 protein n=1 Tax=Solidesulfovibrio sp. TaxID=2910990 RepID=UPI002B218C26|nr:glycosyltransferase family 39 protein [Solidesulfovibrio sp.]MEA4857987.1 glycosyltransferase family 39 protein [Solidesulfovibrio sp.]
MRTDTRRLLYPTLLGLLLAAAAVLRLLYLGEPSLWWDEFITLGIAKLPVSRMLHTLTVVGPSDIGGEFFPPLYHLLTHAVLAVSRDDAVLRLLSVACGTAAVAALYALTAAVFTRAAGLCAAALATFSVYQMHYSRELRPYSLFMLLGLLSFLALYRALTRGGARRYAAYALTTVALCYTAYTATSNIAAEGVFTAWFLLRGLGKKELSPRQALGKGLALGACVAVVGLGYLPWLPAYRNVFGLLQSGGGAPSVPGDFLLTALSEFGAYAAPRRGLPWLPLALLALGGLAVAWRPKWRDGLALFVAFSAMPILAFLAAGMQLELSSRYAFNACYALFALAGLGAAWLMERLAGHLGLSPQQTARGVPLAGLLLCLLVSLPNIRSLPGYYRRETSYSKELADYLAWNKNNVRFLFFQSNRNPKLVTDWYLPGVFENLSTYAAKGYKRAFHLIQSDLATPALPFAPQRRVTIQDTTVSAMGLVSTAPVALFPDAAGSAAYIEDFTTYRFYADCEAADNLAPETRYHTLTHYDYDKPGQADYRFVAADGTTLVRATLRLEFSASFLGDLPSDSRVTIAVAADDAPLTEIDVLTGDSFRGPDGRLVPANHEKRRFITRDYAVPLPPGGAGQLRLRIGYGPVFNPGVIEVTRLEVRADLTGSPAGPGPAEAALRRAAGHNTLADWRPGETLVAADALYAFAAGPGIPRGPANPFDRLAAFRAAHPGLAPVFTIPGPDGNPTYLFYDPALADPFVHLAKDRPVALRLDSGLPEDFAAVKLSGELNRPRLAIGEKAVTVPVLSPAPSTLLLARQTGVLRFEPSFHSEPEALAAFPLSFNIRKNEDEDCLSCKEPGPCSVTVPLSSAYPMRELRILSYPRVFADKAGKNTVTVSFSPDGKQFTPLDKLTSNRSGLWEGLMARRVSVLRFPKPLANGFVRFDLSGPGAQLWSRDDTRMRIEAVLDAAAFAGIPVDSPVFPATLRDNGGAPLSLFLSARPQPYLPALQDDF